jgi:hypothetical protein
MAWAAGCGYEPTEIVAPQIEAADGVQVVVASAAEIQRLADATLDPLLNELFRTLPAEERSRVNGALDKLGAGLYESPAYSMRNFEIDLVSLRGAPAQSAGEEISDTEIAHAALELYRDWTHNTLFGTEPDQLEEARDARRYQ